MGRMLMWHPSAPDSIEHPIDVDERSFEIAWSKPDPPNRPDGWRRWTSVEAAREGREDEPELEDLGPEPPPKTGTGSGRAAWLAYAEERGVTLEGDEGKHQIIKAIEDQQEEEE